MPQYCLAGFTDVRGTNEMGPVNRLLSVPPKSSCPFTSFNDVVGTKDTPKTSVLMMPCEAKLSVTVGMSPPPLVVPAVKSTGPTPRMPSTPCPRHIYSTCWFVRYKEMPTFNASCFRSNAKGLAGNGSRPEYDVVSD